MTLKASSIPTLSFLYAVTTLYYLRLYIVSTGYCVKSNVSKLTKIICLSDQCNVIKVFSKGFLCINKSLPAAFLGTKDIMAGLLMIVLQILGASLCILLYLFCCGSLFDFVTCSKRLSFCGKFDLLMKNYHRRPSLPQEMFPLMISQVQHKTGR